MQNLPVGISEFTELRKTNCLYVDKTQHVFSAAGIEVQSERMTSIGRMDLILELPKLIYVIEVKVNKLPEKGLEQIESQKYYELFLYKDKKIYAVGLSFLRKKRVKRQKNVAILKFSMQIRLFPSKRDLVPNEF